MPCYAARYHAEQHVGPRASFHYTRLESLVSSILTSNRHLETRKRASHWRDLQLNESRPRIVCTELANYIIVYAYSAYYTGSGKEWTAEGDATGRTMPCRVRGNTFSEVYKPPACVHPQQRAAAGASVSQPICHLHVGNESGENMGTKNLLGRANTSISASSAEVRKVSVLTFHRLHYYLASDSVSSSLSSERCL